MTTQPDPQELADDTLVVDDRLTADNDGFDDHLVDDVDDIDDDDPYDSFDEGVPFAHHVISPALLAGFSGAPIALCRTFHRCLFELLDGVGGFDGLILTPAALIGPGDSTKWLGAFSWLRTSPAPDAHAMYDDHLAAGYEPDEASDHVAYTVTHHSLGLATALGTNPSFTHASLPSVARAVLEEMVSDVTQEEVRHIEVLTEVAFALLAITSLDCQVDGGARVVDTGALHDLAREAATSV